MYVGKPWLSNSLSYLNYQPYHRFYVLRVLRALLELGIGLLLQFPLGICGPIILKEGVLKALGKLSFLMTHFLQNALRLCDCHYWRHFGWELHATSGPWNAHRLTMSGGAVVFTLEVICVGADWSTWKCKCNFNVSFSVLIKLLHYIAYHLLWAYDLSGWVRGLYCSWSACVLGIHNSTNYMTIWRVIWGIPSECTTLNILDVIKVYCWWVHISYSHKHAIQDKE